MDHGTNQVFVKICLVMSDFPPPQLIILKFRKLKLGSNLAYSNIYIFVGESRNNVGGSERNRIRYCYVINCLPIPIITEMTIIDLS